MSPMPLLCVRRFWILLAASALAICGQTPPKATGQTPARPAGQTPGAAGGAKKPGASPGASVAAPQSKHYPILLIAAAHTHLVAALARAEWCERRRRR